LLLSLEEEITRQAPQEQYYFVNEEKLEHKPLDGIVLYFHICSLPTSHEEIYDG